MKKKKTLVIGLGISGFAAAKFLLARQVPVVCVDSKQTPPLQERAEVLKDLGAEVHLGVSDLSPFSVKQVVTSPGVPPETLAPFIEKKIPVIGELELGCREVDAPIIAVTGTNGKSTVVETIHTGLLRAGKRSFALGNLGTPVTEWVDSRQEADFLVLEVSSFQLMTIKKFRPAVAVILNVAPDHLAWHGSFDQYLRAKSRIAENQTIEDALLLHKDLQPYSSLQRTRGRLYWFGRDLDPSREGLSLSGNRLEWRGSGLAWNETVDTSGLYPHEIDNLLASFAVLGLSGVDCREVISLWNEPIRLPHRLEEVGVHAGVRFINDSKSTNCHSAVAALKAVPHGGIWLVGGQGKDEDLEELGHAAKDHGVRVAICFGRDAREFAEVLGNQVQTRQVNSLREAFDLAVSLANPGETVLLSPAAASFDEFSSFEERGDCFRRWVRELEEKTA